MVNRAGGVPMVVVADKRFGNADNVMVQPLLLTIPQVMLCLGLGRNKVYDLIHKEGLPVQRFGRAVRVSRIALERWLELREQNVLVR
jgi:excisionase family DNA binding protein